MYNLCVNIEREKNKLELKAAFKQFNAIIRMFLEAAPGPVHDSLVMSSICSVRLSERLKALMATAGSVPTALAQYKEGVVTDLAAAIRTQIAISQLDDEKDDELLLRLLPVPSPLSEVELGPDDGSRLQADVGSARKRGSSAIDAIHSLPKKCKIPALASLSRIQELVDHGVLGRSRRFLPGRS